VVKSFDKMRERLNKYQRSRDDQGNQRPVKKLTAIQVSLGSKEIRPIEIDVRSTLISDVYRSAKDQMN